jgi:hypothetical protein
MPEVGSDPGSAAIADWDRRVAALNADMDARTTKARERGDTAAMIAVEFQRRDLAVADQWAHVEPLPEPEIPYDEQIAEAQKAGDAGRVIALERQRAQHNAHNARARVARRDAQKESAR